MKIQYFDFDLSLTRDGDLYKGEVRSSPAGSSPREVLNWPFTDTVKLLCSLENAVRNGTQKKPGLFGSFETAEQRELREFGRDAFDAVFRNAKGIAQKFDVSLSQLTKDQGLRLKLWIEPPELAALPWEYMFDQSTSPADQFGQFFCLRYSSSLVRFLGEGREAPPINGPIRVLGMISKPSDAEGKQIDVDAERHQIEAALQWPRAGLELKWVRGGSLDDLFDMVEGQTWHVFHFIGHGGVVTSVANDGSIRTEGYVVLQDGLGGTINVSASELGMYLEAAASLRLAVLNCCESAQASNTFSSVGAALVRSGVPSAVAMQFAITDDSAVRFARKLYEHLMKGETIEGAVTTARRFVRAGSYTEWGIPVVFTRAGTSALFTEQAAVAAHVPASAIASISDAQQQARDALRALFT